MSDMGDIYRMARQSAKNGKQARLDKARSLFRDKETGRLPPEWTAHTPYHWSRMVGADKFDYWPSTGKWRWKGGIRKGSPADALKFLTQIQNTSAT